MTYIQSTCFEGLMEYHLGVWLKKKLMWPQLSKWRCLKCSVFEALKCAKFWCNSNCVIVLCHLIFWVKRFNDANGKYILHSHQVLGIFLYHFQCGIQTNVAKSLIPFKTIDPFLLNSEHVWVIRLTLYLVIIEMIDEDIEEVMFPMDNLDSMEKPPLVMMKSLLLWIRMV